MFELARLMGSEEKSIVLETRRPRRVENGQAPEPGEQDLSKFRRLLSERRWELRKPACGIYNCFGHVWAARRTGVYEEAEVKKILDDDGYRELDPGERPVLGDVALYYLRPHDLLWHAGVVWEDRPVLINSQEEQVGPRVPWILSKVNSVCGEVLHALMDFPAMDGDQGFKIEFRTDRPREEASNDRP